MVQGHVALRELQRYTGRGAYAQVSASTHTSESILGEGASLLTERKSP
jgi:hypothetical protein